MGLMEESATTDFPTYVAWSPHACQILGCQNVISVDHSHDAEIDSPVEMPFD